MSVTPWSRKPEIVPAGEQRVHFGTHAKERYLTQQRTNTRREHVPSHSTNELATNIRRQDAVSREPPVLRLTRYRRFPHRKITEERGAELRLDHRTPWLVQLLEGPFHEPEPERRVPHFVRRDTAEGGHHDGIRRPLSRLRDLEGRQGFTHAAFEKRCPDLILDHGPGER